MTERLAQALFGLLTLGGETERSRAYTGAEVLANSGSGTPPPAGFVQVRMEGVGQLARYYGSEPSVADIVDLIMIEGGEPVVLQNRASGIGGGWPYDDIITVSATNFHADYTSPQLAVAGAVAGQTVLSEPSTFTGAATMVADVALFGIDRDGLVITQSTVQTTITVPGSGANLIQNCQIHNERTVNNDNIRAVTITAGGYLHAIHARFYANNAGTVNAYAYALYANDDAQLHHCHLEALTGYNSLTAALYVTGGAIIHLYDCILDGEDYDIIVYNGEVHLHGCVLNNGTILTYPNGAVYGEYWDQTKKKLIDLSTLGDQPLSEDDCLLYLDFQRWEQPAGLTGANRRNAIIGSRGEHCWIGAAADDYDDRGSVIFVPGRWRGDRALKCEPAADNHCDDPCMRDDDASGVADGWTVGSTVAGAPTYTCPDHPDKRRGWMQRYQYAGVAGDVGTYTSFTLRTAAASFAAGDDCTLSMDIIPTDATGCTIQMVIRAENAANANLGVQSVSVNTGPNMDRYDVTYETLPANTDHVQIQCRVIGIDNGDTADFAFGAVNCEKTTYATSFIWGGGGEGFSWSGAPHTTTSSRTVGFVDLADYIDLVNNNNTLSFVTVFRVPYDYDEGWPDANPHIWKVGVAASAMGLKYDTAASRFEVFVDNAFHLAASVIEFNAGDWFAIVVTYDWTNDVYRLYVNGVLEDTYTGAHASGTNTVWVLGAADAVGSQAGGFEFDAFAVVDRILTQAEVGNQYASGLPLVDPKAMMLHQRATVPGVSAGIWVMVLYHDQFSTVNTSYEEVDGVGAGQTYTTRITFSGGWVTGLIFFEANLSNSTVGGTAYSELQYYDVATGAWRSIPESEVSNVGTSWNRVRGTCLCVPLHEAEYRVAIRTTVSNTGLISRAEIVVCPTGEDNL
jgi:hypothetical protein